jgi:hypothetical protein
MIELRPTDFIPLVEFGRAWRFTEAKYNVLPPDAISDLHPIDRVRVTALSVILEDACAFVRTGRDIPVTDIDATRDSDQAHDRIALALNALPIAGEQRVIVGWDRDDALETSWRTFRTYWDDFCYPSSDDVTICPLEGDWVLCYHHWERFSFSSASRPNKPQ